MIAGATAALAAPMCFDPRVPFGDFPAAVIVDKYSRLGRGGCKPFAGWALYYDALPVTGAACLNSTGDTLRVSYTVPKNYPLSVVLVLP